MKELTINTAKTTATINRLKSYLANSNLGKSIVKFDAKSSTLSIEFKSSVEGHTAIPTAEQFNYIRSIIFWSNSIELPYIEEHFCYNSETNILTVTIKYYEIASGLYEMLCKFGVCVRSFDMGKNDLCFCYTLEGHKPFNYDELEQLQNIINPEILYHDSIRVIGCEGVYSLRVNLSK